MDVLLRLARRHFLNFLEKNARTRYPNFGGNSLAPLVRFKAFVLLFVSECVHGLTPRYLSNLLQLYALSGRLIRHCWSSLRQRGRWEVTTPFQSLPTNCSTTCLCASSRSTYIFLSLAFDSVWDVSSDCFMILTLFLILLRVLSVLICVQLFSQLCCF